MKYLKSLEIRDPDKINHDLCNVEFKTYRRELLKLKPRLSAAAWKYFYEGFGETGIHDARLVSLTLGDGLNRLPVWWRTNPLQIRADFINQNQKYRFTFKYQNVQKFSIEFDANVGEVLFEIPSLRKVVSRGSRQLGDVIGDELTAADAKYLRHEFIFATGGRIMIEAAKILFARTRQ